MKKCNMPKPKYNFGDLVVLEIPAEGNNLPKRDAGKISSIRVDMTPAGHQVSYFIEDREDNPHPESNIKRRVVL